MKQIMLCLLLGCFGTLLSAQCLSYNRDGIHVVQKGETLYSISKRYNTSVESLVRLNNMTINTPLGLCQELYVKSPNTTSTTTTVPAPSAVTTYSTATTTTTGRTPVRQPGTEHRVRQGDSVAELARLYGYTEARFREINRLTPTASLAIGQVLISDHCAGMATTAPPSNNTTAATLDELEEDIAIMEVITTEPSENQPANEVEEMKEKLSPFQMVSKIKKEKAAEANEAAERAIEAEAGQIQQQSNPEKVVIPAGTIAVLTDEAPAVRVPTNRVPEPKASIMAPREQLMLDEINLLRADPKGYITYVREYIVDLQTNGSFGNSIQTAQELITELQRTPKLPILEVTPCIYKAAVSHGKDLYARGEMNHRGSDDSWPWDRILRTCDNMSEGNENLVGGPEDIRRAVMLLLVDEGIPSRGHRKTLLNPDWRYAACYSVGQVGDMPNCWVQNFGY